MGYTDAPEGWWREFISATPAKTGKLAFVTITGRAEVGDDPEQVRYWAGRIGGRYMGATRADAERNSVAGGIVVRVRDLKVVAKVAVAD